MEGAPGHDSAGLRGGSVSFLQGLAQAVGTLAPSAGAAILIPMVYAKAGEGGCFIFATVLGSFTLVAAVFRRYAARTASAGGLGHYAECAFGRRGGLLTSWTYLATLLLAVASTFLSALYYANVLLRRSEELPLGPAPLALLALLFGGSMAIAYLGVRFSSGVMLAVECLSLAAIFVLLGLGVARPMGGTRTLSLHPWVPSGLGYRQSFGIAFFALSGFETVTTFGAEARQAHRTIARAISCCVAPVGLFYVLASYLLILGFRGRTPGLAQTLAPFDVLAGSLGLPGLGYAVTIGIFLSVFTSIPANLNAAGRILFDLANRGDFWPRFARVDPRHGSPFAAILLVASLALVAALALLVLGASLDDAMAYMTLMSGVTYLAAYALVALGLPFFLRRQRALGWRDAALTLAVLGIMGGVAFLTLYPVPARPWSLLPYVAAGVVAAGCGSTLAYRRISGRTAGPPPG